MSAGLEIVQPKRTAKDYESDQEIRWCPGCGDYAILMTMKRVFAELGIAREKTVFVSGIGCSSRFPYYMSTYGFHTIHGRAPGFATGIKLTNPELSVWVVTGDGDALSIGGNHFLHTIRRNIDIKIILFNNRIYGLTKGQYSPTSKVGAKTKSSPMGSIDRPLNPISVAIGAEATFIARSVDTNAKQLGEVLKRAAMHKGTSFIEIYQNCVVFNDGAYEYATDKEHRDDNTLFLEHGKPMIFGAKRNRGIRLNGTTPEIVELGAGIKEDDLLFHDESASEPTLAYLLSRMTVPEFPEPMGIFREIEAPVYEQQVEAQIAAATAKLGPGNLDKLFNGGETWVVQ